MAKLFGLEFSYTDESCIIRFPVHDFMFNPQGSLHGGVIAFVMDISMGHLLRKALGVPGITLEMKVQYLAAIRQPSARCEGTFVRRGRKICFMKSQLWNSEDKLAALATSTWQVADPT